MLRVRLASVIGVILFTNQVELVEGAWKEVTPSPETEVEEKVCINHINNH